jgi:ADP-ribosylglycohydrolase/protein-tyrosine phosphatase
MKLNPAQFDRACGAVLGSAVGDALGAPYEFGLANIGPHGPQMIGGGIGRFAPGEWTDDTTMAWCILDVAAMGADLRDDDALTRIARNFRAWYDTSPPDIGNQTRTILGQVGPAPTGATMTATSYDLHARTGHTAGNGSLMRTAPVALPYLDDPVALAEAARKVGALTHYDPHAQEACVLWSLAIRHAILHAEFDIRAGFAHLDTDAAAYWTERLDETESSKPSRFRPNGWAVTALQAAWAAIVHTPVPDTDPRRHLEDALATAIGIGDDTDTVAAIAGALLGARWGASAVPAKWRRICHGYPGITCEQLVELAHLTANRGPGVYDWPTIDRIDYSIYGSPRTLVRHPHDDGVWLGDASALDELTEPITAVVSLCLLGRTQVPDGVVHVGYRLIDHSDAAVNPNLDYMIIDAARTIAALREEGHEVLVHCVAAQSRTPTIGAAYAMLRGVEASKALADVCAVLPAAQPNPGFREALKRLERLGWRD